MRTPGAVWGVVGLSTVVLCEVVRKVAMNVCCSRAFRDAVQKQAKSEDRDVSKLVRRVLREKYPTLPED